MAVMHNQFNREILRQRLMEESFDRVTLSFYRYFRIQDPAGFRDRLYSVWHSMDCFGRIYLAHEGINAQMSVPKPRYHSFVQSLENTEGLHGMPLKVALEDDGKSFYKLTLKIRPKIVADGIEDPDFDSSQVGRHLSAAEFNRAMEEPGTLVVDMRNHYESKIGHFEGALLPDVDTFREELEVVPQMLAGQEARKILLYCTGGIRCEKASAWLKYKGFRDVNQLLGGVIDYARQVKEQGLPNKFKGRNFVFDERMGERITEDVLGNCDLCGAPCDHYTNCARKACHQLFIQCPACSERLQGCCGPNCLELLGVASPPASETGISPDGITPHGISPDPRRKYTKGRLNAQAEAKKPL
jgi:UPF0176 protein